MASQTWNGLTSQADVVWGHPVPRLPSLSDCFAKKWGERVHWIFICSFNTMFLWVHRHGGDVLPSHMAREWSCTQRAHTHPLGASMNLPLQQQSPLSAHACLLTCDISPWFQSDFRSWFLGPPLPVSRAAAVRSLHDERRWRCSETWPFSSSQSPLGVNNPWVPDKTRRDSILSDRILSIQSWNTPMCLRHWYQSFESFAIQWGTEFCSCLFSGTFEQWELECWQLWQLGENRDSENSVGEGEGGMIWENSIETYTLPYVKQITSASFMCDAGHPKPGLCDNLQGWRGWRGHLYSCGWFILVDGKNHHNVAK